MEFALVVPIMLVFLLIIVDFGLAMDRRIILQHAVREGARRAATGAPWPQNQSTTAEEIGLSDPTQVTVCFSDSDPPNGVLGEVGDSIRVGTRNVTYKFTTGSSEMLGVFGIPAPEIQMNPSAEMRLETRVPPGLECE